MKTVRTLFVSDLHIPYQNVQAVRMLHALARDIRPERVVLMGDLVDFGTVSRYAQDPRSETSLQAQLDDASAFLDDIRVSAGRKTEFVYLCGNHETRLTKFLMNNAKQLLFLKQGGQDVLSVPFLLELSRRGIKWVPEHEKYSLHGHVVEHGDCASSYSAYTARRMVDKRRQSVIHCHTHRMGTYWHSGYSETVQGVELGCLIDKGSEAAAYAGGVPNWQTGFGVGEYVAEADFFQITPVWINQGRFVFNGKLYSPAA